MTLSELIERVEKLDGPSRELDLAIGLAVGGWTILDEGPYGTVDVPGDGTYPAHPGSLYPAPTESLDAAIALTERVLPGFGLSVETHPVYGDWWDAAIFDQMPKTISNARKQTAALAVCLGLLRALSAQERDDG